MRRPQLAGVTSIGVFALVVGVLALPTAAHGVVEPSGEAKNAQVSRVAVADGPFGAAGPKVTTTPAATGLDSGAAGPGATTTPPGAAPAGSGAVQPGLTTTSATAFAGSGSGSDPYFPKAGNSGYHVFHYRLKLKYTPASHQLVATAVISARPAERLKRFNLDLRGLIVSSVQVNKQPAKFTRLPGELVITPRRTLVPGQTFVVRIAYRGTTGRPVDNTGGHYGWYTTRDGAMVANEPDGAATWYPVNDVPYDKATYSVTMIVPKGTVGVSNGLLQSSRTAGAWTTWDWIENDVQASYLTAASIGDYRLRMKSLPSGVRIINAIDKNLSPADRSKAIEVLTWQSRMINFFTAIFGPYPFSSFGAIVDDDSLGYALETQTRPIYSGVPDESTVAHEVAHQWAGDSATPRQWRDIWLNEGFATYGEWLWDEYRGGPTLRADFDRVYALPASDPFWQLEPGNPGPRHLFTEAVYNRGAMTLQALRTTIGDEAFFTVLSRWAQENRHGVVTTADLITLAEQVSGKQLSPLFTAWLYTPSKPPLPRAATS